MKQAYRVLLLFAVLVPASSSFAQTYPSKSIRFIVGKAVGTNPDVFARLTASKMQKRLGQPVVVENRVGAGGTIAAKAVVTSESDGYTLLVDSVAALHPVLTRSNAIDASKELVPISNMIHVSYILYSSAKLPVNSLQDLLAYAKANPPGKLNFSSTAPQLDLVMGVLKSRVGFTYTSIPYKGGGPAAITALITGEADLTVSGIVPFQPHVQAGTIRALLFLSSKRSDLLPNVPAAGEVGIANMDPATNVGIWAPVGVPREVVRKLGSEALGIARDPDFVEQARRAGAEAVGSTAEEQLRTFHDEIKFWTEAARLTNYQPQ